MAHAIIHGAGLERYYEEREAFAPRPEKWTASWDAAPAATLPDGTCQVRLAVDGLRCASCVWVTERVLERTPGLIDASISYGSGRATLHWDPQQTSLGELTDRIAHLGYRPRLLGEEARPDRSLTLRLGVAVFAALNVMLVSIALYIGWVDGMDERFQALFRWTSLLLATPVALWCAEPFFVGAWRGLRTGTLHMDLPISIAIATLYGHGLVTTLGGRDGYLDSLTMLVALLLVGRVIESGGRRRAAEAATTLAASLPSSARRVTDTGLETVAADALRIGDRIEVAAGEEVSADGRVIEGAGSVLMALLTGESQPVGVAPGDAVVAGAVLDSGSLLVEVAAVGSDTVVHRMAEAVADAADHTGASQEAPDRIAPWFTGATLLVAGLTFQWWWGAAGLDAALETTVAVLVVACPCALALARPLAAMAALGAAARRGTLLRSTHALLRLAEVDTVAIDKTGTVTEGELVVTSATDATLRVAAGLERASIHPVARAILKEAVARGIPLPKADQVVEEVGVGVRGRLDGEAWCLESSGPGRVSLINERGQGFPIELGDRVRSDARDAVAALRDLGLDVALLTGDHPGVAQRIAAATGVDDIHAAMKPEDKARWVRVHQGRGERVLFVGDGVNDGPALAAADVGLAMRQGAASSILVADGLISGASLESVAWAVRAARAGARAVRTNQRRSILYNIVAVTAAALGWINPLIAAILMPLSSSMVIAGALGIERRLQRGHA